MSTRDQCWARTSLSKQTSTLQVSLLVALGLSPLACFGTALSSGDRAGGGDGGLTPQGGKSGAGAGSGVADVASLCSGAALDADTKLATCTNGLLHRSQALACGSLSTAGAGGTAGSGGAAGVSGAAGAEETEPISCLEHFDCQALKLGWCDTSGPGPFRTCHVGCQQDSDCAPGAYCYCLPEAPAGRCVPGNCQVDSDCGPNSLCALVDVSCSEKAFQCSHGVDECAVTADCLGRGECIPAASGRLYCRGPACGRPFLVSDAPRVAAVASRKDWLEASLTPNLAGLSASARAELAAHWARLGQMEHASIAAFARFNLQLLSLAAPSDLIEACNRALADETQHTRLCFALASRYAGTNLGPDRLDIRHCFEEEQSSLEGVMKLVLSEGCIGETVAALEALEGAASATDPVVRSVLQRIARDEQAHAELAFQFMRWALAQCSAQVREALAVEAEQLLASYARNAERNAQASAARHVVRPILAVIFSASPKQAAA